MTTISITHPQLVAALVKPPADILMTLSLFNVDCLHAAVGISGESGELLECLSNAGASGVGIIDRVNLREELGDMFFYIEQLVQRTGIKLEWDGVLESAREAEITPDLILFYGMEVAIYSAQVLDAVKKAAIYNKELDLPVLEEALLTLAYKLQIICLQHGLSRTECTNANILKLSKRYQSLTYSDKAAQDRADKVQPPEGVIPERKYFAGDPPELPPETTACTQPHVPNAATREALEEVRQGKAEPLEDNDLSKLS